MPCAAEAQARPVALAATRTSGELRALDQQIDQLIRSRDLRLREEPRDPLLPTRRHERLDQYHRGVRIIGGDLTRQSAPDGTVSIIGMLHQGLDLDTAARLSPADAVAAIAKAPAAASATAPTPNSSSCRCRTAITSPTSARSSMASRSPTCSLTPT